MLALPRTRAPVVSLLALVAAAVVSGGALAASPPPAKLDPNVMRVVRTGILGPTKRQKPGSAPVLVELRAPADEASLAALRDAGVVLHVVDGKTLAYDRFVPGKVDAAAAKALAASPSVRRIALLSARGPLPLDRSAELTRLEDARGARPAMDRLTGEGILIADNDSLADVFHPAFFRGDGGYFDWIDVDGDGVFTPGVDAIDFDLDGQAGPGETAEVVFAQTVDYYGPVTARKLAFDPSVDWIYIDANGNGTRDFGAAAGFDDDVPGFGEPLFTPDDVNRNGKLDIGERVIRLGSSKFRAAFTHVEYGFDFDKTYERGSNLSKYEVDVTRGGLYGFADALHATGVLSIVAGDLPLVGRRWVGFAPDADLVLASDEEALPAPGVIWALAQKPDVMLYEMAPWTGQPLDGTDALSVLIDASHDKHQVTHTCPTGDQGSARKHAEIHVGAGKTAELPFLLPTKAEGGDGPLTYVELSINSLGAIGSLTLTEPDGSTFAPVMDQPTSLSTGAFYYATAQKTDRGTDFVNVIFYTNGTNVDLPTGIWTLAVTALEAANVHAYLSDDKSSWALGAAWEPSVSLERSTIGIPSVADHCIAIGAHPNHVASSKEPWFDMYYAIYDVPKGFAEAQGEVRAYSPRGPRIDGMEKPDLLAPDNPWVAAEHSGSGKEDPPHGAVRVFGGTSGASPHVTGVAALLAQTGVRGDKARDALRKGAIRDETTGLAWNPDYGMGRLDAAGALGVTKRGSTPTLELTAEPSNARSGDRVKLVPKAEASGDTEGLELRWDDGYDGRWDTEYGPVEERTVTSDTAAKLPFRARVRGPGGHIAEAVVWVTFSEGGGKGDGGGCGCRVGAREGSGGMFALALGLFALGARRRRS